MKTIMKLDELKTIPQLREFLAGTQPVAFSVSGNKDDRYRWIQRELVRFRYLGLHRIDKGVVLRYLVRITGYSRQQLARLIAQYRDRGELRRDQRTTTGFARRYTDQDIRLLAAMDERHGTPCGPAVKKLCERAWAVFGQAEYQTLAGISVSHLYNLRQSKTCTRRRQHSEKTRPTASTIGERRKPRPDGKPGYIRIDTVHQGDQDKQKGVYHIKARQTLFKIIHGQGLKAG